MTRLQAWRQAALIAAFAILAGSAFAQREMENLSRGMVAVNEGGGKVYVGWRMFGTDPDAIAFNLYRTVGGGEAVKVNAAPIASSTNFEDSGVDVSKDVFYFVKPVVDGKELASSKPVKMWEHNYWEIPLKTPDGYTPGDCSVGDLDGDGQYEIVVHMESGSRDTASGGVTGTPVLQAYKLDGTMLWQINLGINIREGAHYTQFMVYDLDGDGKAELMCKTADGTWDGTGKVIGDKDKDWRTMEPGSRNLGKIEDGPEFLTVFNGETGAAMATVPYIPGRDPKDGWGGIGGNGGTDAGGNRNDRFLACIAYLDGVHPSAVFCRGYYGRSVLAAWDWRDGKLTSRWVFDTGASYPPYTDASKFAGQGAHSVSVADVDGDGKDEIVYHSMVVDDNGKGLFSTGMRHGDALHVGDLNPERPGLEVFGIHENEGDTTRFMTPGSAEYDAKTGEIVWSANPGEDVGRGVSADIDPRTIGDEMWGGPGGLRDCTGKQIGPAPRSQNFAIWWDGDLLRELLDRTHITKWDWNAGEEKEIFSAPDCLSDNGSKATPSLSADLFGDWREEVMFRTADNKHLRIYTTTIPTEHRIYTLMHDPQYRLAIAWQNVAYNQPPHTGFYLGDGMKPAPKPNIVLIGKGEAIAGVKGM